MDARVRYTNMTIKNSFIQLLREKPIEKITVTGICEISEINRATFYKYYADPYDLLQQIEAELILDLQKMIEGTNGENVTDILIVTLDKMRDSGEIYTVLFSDHGDRTFINRVLALCYQATQAQMVHMLPDMPQVQREWLYYFLAQGSCSIINCWAQYGMKEDAGEVAAFINTLTMTLLKELR